MTTDECQSAKCITFVGEVEKKSLMLRLGVGLDGDSFPSLSPFVLSAAFRPFCAELEPLPLELRE